MIIHSLSAPSHPLLVGGLEPVLKYHSIMANRIYLYVIEMCRRTTEHIQQTYTVECFQFIVK